LVIYSGPDQTLPLVPVLSPQEISRLFLGYLYRSKKKISGLKKLSKIFEQHLVRGDTFKKFKKKQS
jgi:hypothetical protein